MDKHEQTLRLEALRAALKVASRHENIGNLMVHAGWLYGFLKSGASPAIESGDS